MMVFESPVPFFRQETEWSCTAACLRMVLAHLGTAVDEATLRECCRTTEIGTHADDAAACARRWVMHAVVAIALDDETVHYLDPARGQRTDALVSFEQAWRMNLSRAILVQAQ